MQINQYTNQATIITDQDYMDWDISMPGGGFLSHKCDLPTLVGSMQTAFPGMFLTLYNSDSMMPSDRVVDHDSFSILWKNVNRFEIRSGLAPATGSASFLIDSFGNSFSNIGMRVSAQGSKTFETYGNNYSKFYNRVEVSGRMTINSPDYGMVVGGGINGAEFTGAIYGFFSTGGDAGMISYPSGSLGKGGVFRQVIGVGALDSEGQLYVYPAGLIGGGVREQSALTQIDSTEKGFLPPRMTYAQMSAISSPAIGLEVYVTDSIEGKYINKSTGWTFIG